MGGPRDVEAGNEAGFGNGAETMTTPHNMRSNALKSGET